MAQRVGEGCEGTDRAQAGRPRVTCCTCGKWSRGGVMTSGTAPAAPFSMYRVRVQDLVGLTLNWVLLLHHIFLVLFQFCLISLQNRSKSTQGQYLVDLLHSVDELLRYCAMLPTLAMPVLPYFLPHKQNQSKSTQPSLKPTVPPCKWQGRPAHSSSPHLRRASAR